MLSMISDAKTFSESSEESQTIFKIYQKVRNSKKDPEKLVLTMIELWNVVDQL